MANERKRTRVVIDGKDYTIWAADLSPTIV